MCYYTEQKVSRAEYIRLLNLEKEVKDYDFLNVDLHDGFTYGNVAVVKPNSTKTDFDIVQMEWGYIPAYWKTREEVSKFRRGFIDPKSGKFINYITLNAKGEELLLPNKMYREAALHRRCLLLCTGFYEWQHIYPTNKKTGKPLKTAKKYPYYISLKESDYFFIAGVWNAWTDLETGEYVETVSAVTEKANQYMEKIHNSKKRMPTILPEELAYEWIFGNLSESRITELATNHYSSNILQACSIDKDFKTKETPSEPFQYSEEDLPVFETVFSD